MARHDTGARQRIAARIGHCSAETRSGDDPFPWWLIIGCYALAELCEAADFALWDATNGAIAGHALKHLAAAVARLGAFRPLRDFGIAHPAGRAAPFVLRGRHDAHGPRRTHVIAAGCP